ncbi:hypothetical protein G3I30_18275 [Actinospica acidiphila]|uniref:Uncharacterized protein n=2 Tax=Streptomyces TaxID=1883 RepID=A0ABP7Z6H7_9ACTN|nr:MULTISPECIES: hypothetical protein [Streptomyces]MBJ6616504.1 hypothetical protein [Streptomyces sp. I3(2020)]MUT90260.1 hypothetical protein [Streptomyces sp. Z38]NEA80987.1 hypothetical protein [Actinospica acidiphila]MBJ6627198.1 hypothetical protein [Streptomyces sp. I4(2020)]MBJ6632625.1 hypothetical protein [Streptomyces sp. I5]
MDPEIAALAGTAGTTVVTLMVTNAWESARDGMVALWRRFQPARAESIGEELEAGRADLLLARQAGDADSEAELTVEWQGRLRRFLLARPEAAEELRRVLDELTPQLPGETAAERIRMEARASGSARIYQAGRDQHITDR